jgi:hypothetical protein
MVGLAPGKTRGGQLNDETGATADPLFIPQTAIVHVEEAGAQEQSQPQPFPPGTLGNEWLEQLFPDALGHSGTIVFDSEYDPRARGPVWLQADPDRGALAPLERVEGVAQQPADNFAHHMPREVDVGSVPNVPHHSNSLLMGGRQECRQRLL